jgi:L-ribulose-5-phosphate 4-epimerase
VRRQAVYRATPLLGSNEERCRPLVVTALQKFHFVIFVCFVGKTVEIADKLMTDEGYIKFSVHLNETDIEVPEALSELNGVRTALFDNDMIGVLPGGIGFGNVSVKMPGSSRFFISGSATGGKRILDTEDYCRVDSCSAERNEVFCSGHIKASSETLSHDAVYQANDAVRCVIHIHHKTFFYKLLSNTAIPSTSKEAKFGTPEMATDIERIVKTHTSPCGLLVMAGHEDGIIAWGRTIAEAYSVLLHHFENITQN